MNNTKARTLAASVTIAFVLGIAQFLSKTSAQQYPGGGGPYPKPAGGVVTNITVLTNVNIATFTNVTIYDSITINTNVNIGGSVFITNNITVKGNATIANLNVTNVVIQGALWYPTNGVSSATAIDFAVPEATTNISANLAFTSLANITSTNYNCAIRHIVNTSGANKTLTTGASWYTDPVLRTSATTYTITNNTVVNLLVEAQIGQYTNAIITVGSQ